MFKRYWRILFFILGFSPMAAAQDGVAVRVSADFIERELQPYLRAELGSKFKSLRIERKDAATSRIIIKGRRSILSGEAVIDVGYSCWFRDPDVRVVYKSHEVKGGLLGVNFFSLGNIERGLVQEILRAVKAELPAVITDCPRFQVESNGDISLNWQHGSQCADGAAKHSACGYNQWGDGIDHLCVNGYWEIESRMCESCADSPHPSCPRRPGPGGRPGLPLEP